MKKTIISKLLIACILTSSMVSAAAFAASPASKAETTVKKESYQLIKTLKADVLGDQSEDEVTLSAKKHPDSTVYYDQFKLTVKDGKTGKTYTHELNGGYEPELFLGDFTGDKKAEMMIQSDAGGSGGIQNVSILTFENGKFLSLMDSAEKDANLKFESNFKDNFKAYILNKDTNMTFALDLSGIKSELIKNGAYDKDGKVLAQDMGWTDGIKMALPADVNGDGSLELLCSTAIFGKSHVDKLSTVNWTYQYDSKSKTWKVVDLDMSTPVYRAPMVEYK